jgi:hypothetical protein
MHPAGGDERDEDRAFGADTLGQTTADAGRRGDVVDENGRRLERRGRDCGRLVLEIDRDLGSPVGLGAVLHADQAARATAVVADQRNGREIDGHSGSDLSHEEQAGRARVGSAQERVGKRLVRLLERRHGAAFPARGPPAAEEGAKQ